MWSGLRSACVFHLDNNHGEVVSDGQPWSEGECRMPHRKNVFHQELFVGSHGVTQYVFPCCDVRAENKQKRHKTKYSYALMNEKIS